MWTGRFVTAVPIVVLLLSAGMKLGGNPRVVEEFTGRLGYQAGALAGLALLEIACVVLYALPSTAVLGAILLTGYLGGAVATHVRIGEPFLAPLAVGVLAWAGLYLRDQRLHSLLPIRRSGR